MFRHICHERLHSGLSTRLPDLGRMRFTSYFAQRSKLKRKEGKLRDEGATLLEAVDVLRHGKTKKVVDLPLMRYMALGQSVEGGNWNKAMKFELRSNVTGTIAGP